MVPETGKEAVVQCLAICIMQLTNEEAETYKDIPIIEEFGQAVFFPPDENIVKLCSCRFLPNYKNKNVPGASIIHSLGDYPFAGGPKEVEDEIRAFVADVDPKLKEPHPCPPCDLSTLTELQDKHIPGKKTDAVNL